MTTTEQIAAFADVPGPQGSGVAGVAPEFLRDPSAARSNRCSRPSGSRSTPT